MIETGRVTVPTDVDVIDATIEIINRWKADAIRDCDGTDMPEELRKMDIKQYATYYTTRKEKIMSGQRQIQMKSNRCI